MGCGEFLVKYIVFFANLFFALAGLTLLGIGVAAQLRTPVLLGVFGGLIQGAPISAMVVGGVAFVIAFFGCCGAIRESNCMLVTYSILMLMLMILKITLATLIFVKMDEFIEKIPEYMSTAFTNDIEAYHRIETTFQCCGTTGPVSYLNVSLPPSCCTPETTTCTVLNSYGGCNEKIETFFNTFGLLIGIMAVAVGAVELVAVVFGLCLANNARNKSRRARY